MKKNWIYSTFRNTSAFKLVMKANVDLYKVNEPSKLRSRVIYSALHFLLTKNKLFIILLVKMSCDAAMLIASSSDSVSMDQKMSLDKKDLNNSASVDSIQTIPALLIRHQAVALPLQVAAVNNAELRPQNFQVINHPVRGGSAQRRAQENVPHFMLPTQSSLARNNTSRNERNSRQNSPRNGSRHDFLRPSLVWQRQAAGGISEIFRQR